MSKRLECVVEGCDAVIEAESEEEVMAEVEPHVAEAHPELELTEETVQSVRDQIQDV